MERAALLGSVPEQRTLCGLGSWVVAGEMAGEACPTASCRLRSPCRACLARAPAGTEAPKGEALRKLGSFHLAGCSLASHQPLR